MDYDDQRHMFAITIGGAATTTPPHPTQHHTPHTHPSHTHTHTHTLMQTHMDNISTGAPHIHQQQHITPQPHHMQLEVGGVAMVGCDTQQTEAGPSIVAVLTDKQTHHQQNASIPETDNLPETEMSTENTYTGWCLVCGKELTDGQTDALVNLHQATMTISQRGLRAMLGRLVGLAAQRAHSDVLCRRCFTLVEKVDGLEIELADTKLELTQLYEATLAHRRPTAARTVTRPMVEVDVEWDESNESDPLADDHDDDDDPDCLANGAAAAAGRRSRRGRAGAKKAKRKTQRPRKVRVTAKVEVEGEVEEGPARKRGRGRPRKKDKEEEEAIPPGAPTKDCPACTKVVHAKKYLTHLSSHRLFPCPFCEAVCKRKDIKTHLAESHQEEIHYPCTECDQVFDTFMQLRTHCLVVHMGVEREEYTCKTCARKFSSVTGLKVHIETIHEKTQIYECPQCKELFNQKGNMQNHFRRVHQGQEARKLLCDICNKGFICPSDLRKHVERVHLKVRKNEVMCEVCGKPFSDSRAMRIHINAVHTREIQHPCPECKMVFHSLTNMVTHRRRMHGGPEGRRNVCKICGKGFCSPSDLKTHIRVVHDNIRKYVCDICGQAFKVCSHLKYHRRKHTGEAPYECPHCGKCFHGPSHISDHVKKVHKTVYIGTNQRRKLNLPDSAPPPPPGMLPSRDSKPRGGKTMTPAPPPSLPHAAYPQPMPCLPTTGVSTGVTMTSFSPAHHAGNMLPPPPPPAPQPNPPMLHPQGLIEHHSGYANFQFQVQEQPPPQPSPVPMVVRLLHDLQYQ